MKSIIKQKNKCDKVVLLGKDMLNTIKVIISRALIDSYVSHDEFYLVNNILTIICEKIKCQKS